MGMDGFNPEPVLKYVSGRKKNRTYCPAKEDVGEG